VTTIKFETIWKNYPGDSPCRDKKTGNIPPGYENQCAIRVGYALEKSGVWISRRVRPIIPPWWCPEIADNRHRAKLPENPSNIVLSGQNAKLINGSALDQRMEGR